MNVVDPRTKDARGIWGETQGETPIGERPWMTIGKMPLLHTGKNTKHGTSPQIIRIIIIFYFLRVPVDSRVLDSRCFFASQDFTLQ